MLIFRGTAGRLYNWRFNLDIVPAPWSTGGKVHRGFKYLLNTIWPEICDTLDENKFPLFYTGHSMGGAIANMAASLRPPRAVYTFGAPRIGDVEFARTLASIPVFNVINARDIVTGRPVVTFFSCRCGREKQRYDRTGARFQPGAFYSCRSRTP